jgi:hypothetical protein
MQRCNLFLAHIAGFFISIDLEPIFQKFLVFLRNSESLLTLNKSYKARWAKRKPRPRRLSLQLLPLVASMGM